MRTKCRALSGLHVASLFITVVASIGLLPNAVRSSDERLTFFESKIRPALIEHCYKCHSEDSSELAGGLRLDVRAGWQLGGDSGQPAIVPGQPEKSPLILAVRHAADVSAMPPKQAKLPERVIADLAAWIESGAFDPREGTVERPDKAAEWETQFQQRLKWWSLQPVKEITVPSNPNDHWSRNEIDRLIRAKLEAKLLAPNAEADRGLLVRRLSFALTGLPPSPELIERYAKDSSEEAYQQLVNELLASPHFGERWARHWMDVVHYSDTHGYEWDVPAKNAWRYRDYLIRAFNDDLPYNQLIVEQIAGDLVTPRINPATGINESLIGPMMLRLGERRHGDNAAIDGVTQEAVANMIDTLGKAFLGTTLACAQCHDHKIDAVEQRDYYSLAGMLMSTRLPSRAIDTVDPNLAVIEELKAIKSRLRAEVGGHWLSSITSSADGGVVAKLNAIAADAAISPAFPESIVGVWKRFRLQPITKDEFEAERQRRVSANEANLRLIADFAVEGGERGWRWEGWGMKHGRVENGDFAVHEDGDLSIRHLLPAGRFSHVYSTRLAGSLQSPEFDPTQPATFSVEAVAGNFTSQSFIIDQALNPERLQFPKLAFPVWQTLTAGQFDSLEGTIDRAPRRVYFEMATKSLNNYFPPRVGYGGVSEAELSNPQSWFGVSKIYRHDPGKPPLDDLTRFAPLFESSVDSTKLSLQLTELLHAAVQRWMLNAATSDDVRLINDALQNGLLPNEKTMSSAVAQLVDEYRRKEKDIIPDQTVGSAAEWNEGRDDRIAVRGSYTELGDSVPRGMTRCLSIPAVVNTLSPQASGRLQWAQSIANDRNPLVARVYVNRVWHYLFGTGLVRTTDDFGHLGEPPVHPELLDYLAARFVTEGWSTKALIRRLVSSSTFRQAGSLNVDAMTIDPENRLWHHMPVRRLEAESIRDALLSVSGRLDPTLFGAPIEPYRTAEDSQKRLFKGPLDGHGRRSLYLEMTLMEPPRFLALFNQPIPKQTVGRRDVTITPDQALAMLNDPFVADMARHWSERIIADSSMSIEDRSRRMIERALGRPARDQEVAALTRLVRESAAQHAATGDLLRSQPVWQDAAHAVFNLKEFIYVP